jgi:hypothetical protein
MGIISERGGFVRKGVMTVAEALRFFVQAREVLGPDAPLLMCDGLHVTLLEIKPERGCVIVSDPDQPEWKPPAEFPPAEYRLDGGRRIARRYARLEHMEEAIRYAEASGVPDEEVARMKRELELLRPYWGPGVTKEEAIRAYYDANPPTK